MQDIFFFVSDGGHKEFPCWTERSCVGLWTSQNHLKILAFLPYLASVVSDSQPEKRLWAMKQECVCFFPFVSGNPKHPLSVFLLNLLTRKAQLQRWPLDKLTHLIMALLWLFIFCLEFLPCCDSSDRIALDRIVQFVRRIPWFVYDVVPVYLHEAHRPVINLNL